MPDEGETDFESELDAILNAGGEKDSTLPKEEAQTSQATEAKLKFGGREWENPSDLGKAYEALQKDYSKKGSALKEAEKWVSWGKQIEKHPELHRDMEERIKAFNQKLQAGQSTAQAAQGAGIPREVAQRLEVLETREAHREVQAEIAGLKNKYKLDPADMNSVIEKATNMAENGVNLPLEDVYRIVMFDKRALAAQASGKQAGAESMRRKQQANVGGSSPSGVAPAAKTVSEMSGDEFDNALSEMIKGTGLGT